MPDPLREKLESLMFLTMENSALVKNLEDHTINLPDDYSLKILAISNSSEIQRFAKAIVHNIEKIERLIKAQEDKSLNAWVLVGIFWSTIILMTQKHASKSEIISVLDLTPKYLAVLITNKHILQDAIIVFNGGIDALKSEANIYLTD